VSNFIYGKVKRKSVLYRIIETATDVYDTSNLVLSGLNYNPNTLIEEEELFKIDSFSTSGFAIDFLRNDLDSVNHDQITRDDLRNLSYICAVQSNLYFFQVINSTFYVSKKWFSIDELRLEVEKPIITINSIADAIYDRTNDVLYFKKLSAAQKIFKGMDQLFREATNQETQDFLSQDFLSVDPSFGVSKVTVPNRKRIAMVGDTLRRLTDEQKQSIYEYTSQYGNVIYENGSFKIQTDEDLKFVLWGIEQRFYTTLVGGERRVANSIISI
jgi:hypothetical protein